MCKIKVGDKVRIVGNSRIHHYLVVPSTATVIDMDSSCVEVLGYGDNGRMYNQLVSFVDIEPIRKAVVL